MFPSTRTRQIALALGTLIMVVLFAIPPVSFQLTDLGLGYGAVSFNLVGDAAPRPAATRAVFHIGGCKSVGHTDLCSHKELTFDRAHGLRFTATLTTHPPDGV
jgi:hypothetical protein